MKHLYLSIVLLLTTALSMQAQTGTAFFTKGGLTMARQNWNGQDRNFLTAYHAALGLESVNDSINLSFYGQIGYHVKGSSQRFNSYYNPNTMTTFPRRTVRQTFRQASVAAGIKNRYETGMFDSYFLVGLRLDYLIDYQNELQNQNYNNDGFDQFVNKINYGLTIGGGLEYEFKNAPIAIFTEISISPDVSKQVFLQGGTYPNPTPTNPNATYPETKVVNMAIEMALGVKFIRRVEWVSEWDEGLLPTHRNILTKG